MVQATILAVLTLSNHYSVWELITLGIILGIINAFDSPARQPLVHAMIPDKADIPNAVALNSSMVNFAAIIGPALAGIILAKFSAGTCFLLNALSFIAVITSLLLMKLPSQTKQHTKDKKISTELKEGISYLKNTPSIANIMLMLTLISLLVLPYETLLPVFAKVIFNGNSATFGYIRSFIGVGAIGGTIFLASLKPRVDLKIVLLVNTIILGIGLILFSRLDNFPLAMIFAVIFGFGAMAQTTICLTIIQVNTEAENEG